MDAKSLKTLKTGDQIQWARGTMEAGHRVTFIGIHPSLFPAIPEQVRIEFDNGCGTRIVPHDRFVKAK